MSSWNGDPGVSPQAKGQQAMERGLVGGTMAGMEAMTGGAELRALGRGGLSALNRLDDAYGTGGVVNGMQGIGNKVDAWRAGKAESLAQRRSLEDTFNNARDRSPMQYEGLLPGQKNIRDYGNSAGIPGGGTRAEFDVGRYAQGNPNATLDDLYRMGNAVGRPGPSAGSTVRTNPDRFGSVIRNNPDREKYAQGLEKLPGGNWGRKVYDSKAPMSNEEFDLWAAANRYRGATGNSPIIPSAIDRLIRKPPTE
jgi:hypothetical protein